MNKLFICLYLFSFCLISCHHVDSNAVTGAREFCEEMALYEAPKDYVKANECLERYWKAYSESDQLEVFCMALLDEFKTQKYNHIATFIGNTDRVKYPLFLEFMKYFIAVNEARMINDLNNAK